VLLSDRDIKAEIGSGRVKLDPFAPDLIQPSSIDVRLDRYFRCSRTIVPAHRPLDRATGT